MNALFSYININFCTRNFTSCTIKLDRKIISILICNIILKEKIDKEANFIYQQVCNFYNDQAQNSLRGLHFYPSWNLLNNTPLRHQGI